MKRYSDLRLEGAKAVDAISCLVKEGLIPASSSIEPNRTKVGIVDDTILFVGIEDNRLISAEFGNNRTTKHFGNEATTTLTGLPAKNLYEAAGRCFSPYKLPEP